MNKNTLYIAIAMFILGFITSNLITEQNVRFASNDNENSVNSPSDWILDTNLHVFTDKAVIEKQGLMWARIKDTHSMEPVLNSDSISLETKPDSPDIINIGDIISFKQDNKVIIHRVIDIGEDNQGWFAATKGDNNKAADPYKVRFEQIEGVVVGILY